MEISGYPHYENVCSNILAFYFNPKEEHGLGDLLLCAFLRMTGRNGTVPPGDVKIYRECVTDAGKRLDVIIESEAFTIGIENKIYHHLANDLEDYASVIDGLGDKDIIIKTVLGLQQIPGTLKGGFTSYSYSQLWQNVKHNLGAYVAGANPKWLTYLIDFMENITNLAGQDMELQKTDQFFIDYDQEIEKLVNERNAFLKRLTQEVLKLHAMMKNVPETAALSGEPWIYDGRCLVLDFRFGNAYAIAFDLYLTPKRWELQLFGRSGKASAFLRKLISLAPLHARAANAPIAGNRQIVQTWPIHTDLAEIRDALRSWMGALSDSAKVQADLTAGAATRAATK